MRFRPFADHTARAARRRALAVGALNVVDNRTNNASLPQAGD